MKFPFLFIFCILSISGFSQWKKPLLNEFESQDGHYSDNDSTRIYSFDDFEDLILTTYKRGEYFVAEDTIHRDFIQIGLNYFILDKLLMSPDYSEYTINYDLVTLYSIGTEDVIYAIFEGVNTFPMGTDQQVNYIILVLDKNGWRFHSSYYNGHNMPTDNIKVRMSKDDNLILKGKYLSRNQ